MVQVLPYIPSFLENLNPHINQAAQNIGTSIEQRNAMRGLQALLNPQQGQNQTPGQANQAQMPGQPPQQQQPGPTTRSPLEALQVFKMAEKAVGPQGAKILTDSLLQNQKLQEKEAAQIRKEDRAITSIPAKKYLENVESFREKQRSVDLALNAEMDAIHNGEVDPFSAGHIAEIAKQFDLPQALVAPLETVGSKEFRTGQKTFLTNTFNDAFRGSTTKGQIELASSLLAESGATREANLASIYLLQAQHFIEKERLRLTDEALEEGISPNKIPRYVDKKLGSYAKHINDEYFTEVGNLRREARK